MAVLFCFFILQGKCGGGAEGRGGTAGEALPGSILWWMLHSTLNPFFRQFCSFSTAVFVLGEEDPSRLLLEQRQSPREGVPQLPGRKAGAGFCLSGREFIQL